MPGDVLRLGPFVGGLNLASDISSVADEELVECINLELDIDGSLKNRPPFQRKVSTGVALAQGSRIIGSAVFGGVGYIFASGKSPSTERIQYSTDGIEWTTITSTRYSLTCVQYRDKVWFPAAPGSTGTSCNWDPVGGTTEVASMPKSSHCVIHKERMYVVPGMTASTNTSRLTFSAPADLTSWPGVNFIDVSPGDGETLNAVIVYNDNLLLFKDSSVFVLAYDLNPSDAILREINPVLGAPDGDSVIQFENVVYALHDDIVYEVVNYDFNPINIKAPFVLDTSVPSGLVRTQNFCLSTIGDRLVVKYFNKIYVFGLRTRTWSEWTVTADSANQWHDTTKFYQIPLTETYVARRAFTTSFDNIHIPTNPTITHVELDGDSDDIISCSIKTKDFDYADPVHYKRLFWWSADILSGNLVTGKARIVSYTFSPTWDGLGSLTWDELFTWDQLTTEPLPIITTRDADDNYQLAKTAKFDKGLRFRKINFEVILTTDGSVLRPAKLFSLTTTVLTKQGIVKKVS